MFQIVTKFALPTLPVFCERYRITPAESGPVQYDQNGAKPTQSLPQKLHTCYALTA